MSISIGKGTAKFLQQRRVVPSLPGAFARFQSSSSSSPNESSSNVASRTPVNSPQTSVYVHPLSQIVLRHFQTDPACHDWIVRKKLDRNLTLHRDGTFVLEQAQPELSLNDEIIRSSSSTDQFMTTQDANNNNNKYGGLRIWTYYDPTDKKHWLSVQSNEIRHRFLLQDNLMPLGNQRYPSFNPNTPSNRPPSLPERIHQSVYELMGAVDELEH